MAREAPGRWLGFATNRDQLIAEGERLAFLPGGRLGNLHAVVAYIASAMKLAPADEDRPTRIQLHQETIAVIIQEVELRRDRVAKVE